MHGYTYENLILISNVSINIRTLMQLDSKSRLEVEACLSTVAECFDSGGVLTVNASVSIALVG
jgi:hypothetical protein